MKKNTRVNSAGCHAACRGVSVMSIHASEAEARQAVDRVNREDPRQGEPDDRAYVMVVEAGKIDDDLLDERDVIRVCRIDFNKFKRPPWLEMRPETSAERYERYRHEWESERLVGAAVAGVAVFRGVEWIPEEPCRGKRRYPALILNKLGEWQCYYLKCTPGQIPVPGSAVAVTEIVPGPDGYTPIARFDSGLELTAYPMKIDPSVRMTLEEFRENPPAFGATAPGDEAPNPDDGEICDYEDYEYDGDHDDCEE